MPSTVLTACKLPDNSERQIQCTYRKSLFNLAINGAALGLMVGVSFLSFSDKVYLTQLFNLRICGLHTFCRGRLELFFYILVGAVILDNTVSSTDCLQVNLIWEVSQLKKEVSLL